MTTTANGARTRGKRSPIAAVDQSAAAAAAIAMPGSTIGR